MDGSLRWPLRAARADSSPAGPEAYLALTRRAAEVRLHSGDDPGWQVVLPLGSPRPFGVLDVRVSTQRLQDWARQERRRAYLLALLSALLLSLGVAVITARWVGRPLGAIGARWRAPTAEPNMLPPLRRSARRNSGSSPGATIACATPSPTGSGRVRLVPCYSPSRSGREDSIGWRYARDRRGLRARDRHAAQHGERPPAAAARRSRGPSTMSEVSSESGCCWRRSSASPGIVRAGLDRGGWPKPAVRTVDLTDVAARMTRFLEPSFADAGVVARLEGSGNGARPVLASCDPSMVEQILLNLLKNAIEALASGNIVSIRTGRSGHEVYIEVQDDGPGLDPEAESNLFRPFSTTKGAGRNRARARRQPPARANARRRSGAPAVSARRVLAAHPPPAGTRMTEQPSTSSRRSAAPGGRRRGGMPAPGRGPRTRGV